MNKKKIFLSTIIMIIELFLYYYIFIKNKVIEFDNTSNIINVSIIILNSYLITIVSNIKYKIKEMPILYFISLVIAFFVCGKKLFLTEGVISISLKSLLLFFLISILLLPFINNILSFIENTNIKEVASLSKKKQNSWKFFILIFMIFFGIWTIVGLSFFPGNLTSDSTSQFAQAMGLIQIDNAHPAFGTIIIRWLLKIWKNPFVVLLAYITYFSIILAYIYRYLYEQNVNKVILICTAILFAISCNNLSLMTMIWKDIPFTISLLWLTFELYKISKEGTTYFNNNWSIVKIFTALLFTYFFRHNGLVVYLTAIVYLIFLAYKSKSKRIIFTIIISAFSIWFIKNPVYNYYKVDSSNIMSSGTASFAAKGLGALVYYQGSLTKEEQKQIEKIADLEDLKKYYSPYSIDTYSFQNIGWDDGIKELGVNTIYQLYIENALETPTIIIRDRLDSCDLLWDYTTPKDGFNYKYDIGIAYPKFIKEFKGYKKNSGIKYIPPENELMSIVTEYQEYTGKVVSLDILYWRPALILSIFLLLLIVIIRNRMKIFPCVFPTFISIIFWALLMSHQSYRYLWFLPVNVFFIFLLTMLEKQERVFK